MLQFRMAGEWGVKRLDGAERWTTRGEEGRWREETRATVVGRTNNPVTRHVPAFFEIGC